MRAPEGSTANFGHDVKEAVPTVNGFLSLTCFLAYRRCHKISYAYGSTQAEGISEIRHVATSMRKMGIEALYQRPRTTKPHPGQKVFLYLLRHR
jgi:hypothetical protein